MGKTKGKGKKPKAEALTPFLNNRGRAYMFPYSDGRITKREYERDRLRVLGGKAYAIDATDLRKALLMGMGTLVIKETTLKGKTRRYEVSLSEIQEKERPIRLAGVERYPIYLARCVCTSGEIEPWQIAEREALVSMAKKTAAAQSAAPVQGSLFAVADLSELSAYEYRNAG